MVEASASPYTGSTFNGKRHGWGKESFASGGSYEGWWQEDQR